MNNTNFHVSETRLTLRNFDKKITEGEIKVIVQKLEFDEFLNLVLNFLLVS